MTTTKACRYCSEEHGRFDACRTKFLGGIPTRDGEVMRDAQYNLAIRKNREGGYDLWAEGGGESSMVEWGVGPSGDQMRAALCRGREEVAQLLRDARREFGA